MKRAIYETMSFLLMTSFLILLLSNTANADPEGIVAYYPNITYGNVRSCSSTLGGGVWTEPIENKVGSYVDPPYDHGEIGVLEIIESHSVYRVEVYGSGCVNPVTLTCNGISLAVSFYHDSTPFGYETLTFDILPSNVITLFTTVHGPGGNHGFGIKWIKLYYMTEIQATIDIDPDSLNLRSRGKWITAYIGLPEDYNVSDIDVSSILLNETVSAQPKPKAIGDYDNDTIPDLMVKFERQAVIDLILGNYQCTDRFGTVTLTTTGRLNDGTQFQGSDTINIICDIRLMILLQWI